MRLTSILTVRKFVFHRGGYASFCADITNFIHIGENDITVCAIDDVRSMKQPRGKQSTPILFSRL